VAGVLWSLSALLVSEMNSPENCDLFAHAKVPIGEGAARESKSLTST